MNQMNLVMVKLVPIETDEEWDMIEEVVNTNMEE